MSSIHLYAGNLCLSRNPLLQFLAGPNCITIAILSGTYLGPRDHASTSIRNSYVADPQCAHFYGVFTSPLASLKDCSKQVSRDIRQYHSGLDLHEKICS